MWLEIYYKDFIAFVNKEDSTASGEDKKRSFGEKLWRGVVWVSIGIFVYLPLCIVSFFVVGKPSTHYLIAAIGKNVIHLTEKYKEEKGGLQIFKACCFAFGRVVGFLGVLLFNTLWNVVLFPFKLLIPLGNSFLGTILGVRSVYTGGIFGVRSGLELYYDIYGKPEMFEEYRFTDYQISGGTTLPFVAKILSTEICRKVEIDEEREESKSELSLC